MKFSSKVTLVGAKSSKGELDNGTKYDSTKVYCLVDLDATKGTSVGQAVAEYRWGASENLDLIRGAFPSLPCEALADFEMVTNGAAQKIQLVNLRIAK